MAEEIERIAVLEEQHRAMKGELDEIQSGVKDIRDGMANVEKALSKQRGFWAGVTFAASIVGFFLKELWSNLKSSL